MTEYELDVHARVYHLERTINGLRADNVKLRVEIERLKTMFRTSDAENDELRGHTYNRTSSLPSS